MNSLIQRTISQIYPSYLGQEGSFHYVVPGGEVSHGTKLRFRVWELLETLLTMVFYDQETYVTIDCQSGTLNK